MPVQTVVTATTPTVTATAILTFQSIPAAAIMSLPEAPSGLADLPTSTPLTSANIKIIGERSITNDSVSRLFFDDKFVYWVLESDTSAIRRAPIAGGPEQRILQSAYPHGDIALIPPMRVANWLIYADLPYHVQDNWILMALDLTTLKTKVLFKSEDDGGLPPRLSTDGRSVVATYELHRSQPECTATIMTIVPVETMIPRELRRICAEGNYLWNIVGIEGNTIVADRQLPNATGGGSDIVQFDLNPNTEPVSITTNGASSEPSISADWVIWKDGIRWKNTNCIGVLNRKTNIQSRRCLPEYFAYAELRGHFVYAPYHGHSVYLFDLTSDKALEIARVTQGTTVRDTDVRGDTIAWVVDQNDVPLNKQTTRITIATLKP